MTQRAIEVVPQEPLLQAFPVENVQAPQFANLLRAVYLLQTNGAEQKVSYCTAGQSKINLPNELSIHGLR
jgi:hypothetical protein